MEFLDMCVEDLSLCHFGGPLFFRLRRHTHSSRSKRKPNPLFRLAVFSSGRVPWRFCLFRAWAESAKGVRASLSLSLSRFEAVSFFLSGAHGAAVRARDRRPRRRGPRGPRGRRGGRAGADRSVGARGLFGRRGGEPKRRLTRGSADETHTHTHTHASRTKSGLLWRVSQAVVAALSDRSASPVEYPPYGSWHVGLAWCACAFAALTQLRSGVLALFFFRFGISNAERVSSRGICLGLDFKTQSEVSRCARLFDAASWETRTSQSADIEFCCRTLLSQTLSLSLSLSLSVSRERLFPRLSFERLF